MPSGGRIKLDWTHDEDVAVVEISDDGPGLPESVRVAFEAGGRVGQHQAGREWSRPAWRASPPASSRRHLRVGPQHHRNCLPSDDPIDRGSSIVKFRARILVADDQRDVATTLTAGLRDAGAFLSYVTDGEEALQRVAAGGFDLVLLDMKMPPGDWGGLLAADPVSGPWLEHSSDCPVRRRWPAADDRGNADGSPRLGRQGSSGRRTPRSLLGTAN